MTSVLQTGIVVPLSVSFDIIKKGSCKTNPNMCQNINHFHLAKACIYLEMLINIDIQKERITPQPLHFLRRDPCIPNLNTLNSSLPLSLS